MSQCSAAVVKPALSQYSGEQCVTKTEGGPACVRAPGGPTMVVKPAKQRGWEEGGRVVVATPPLKTILIPSVRGSGCFSTMRKSSQTSSLEPLPPHTHTHTYSKTTYPSVPLFVHRCLLIPTATKPATAICSHCINRQGALPVRLCRQMAQDQTITEQHGYKISLNTFAHPPTPVYFIISSSLNVLF